jgi:hypothetical protein
LSERKKRLKERAEAKRTKRESQKKIAALKSQKVLFSENSSKLPAEKVDQKSAEPQKHDANSILGGAFTMGGNSLYSKCLKFKTNSNV